METKHGNGLLFDVFKYCFFIFAILLILKLTAPVLMSDVNWWVVTSPIWMPLGLTILAITIFASLIAYVLRDKSYDDYKDRTKTRRR